MLTPVQISSVPEKDTGYLRSMLETRLANDIYPGEDGSIAID